MGLNELIDYVTGNPGAAGAAIGIGGALTGAFDGSQKAVGYQGNIPRYQASREQVPYAENPDRRPGSGGRRYFSDTVYSQPMGATPMDQTGVTEGIQVPTFEQAQTATQDQAAAIAAGGRPEALGYSTQGYGYSGPSAADINAAKQQEFDDFLSQLMAQANEDMATQQPATQQPATQQPATQQPATQQPATQQPATQQPAAQNGAINTPDQWLANKDFIISKVNDGSATPEQLSWYSKWLNYGSPQTQAEMHAMENQEGLTFAQGGLATLSSSNGYYLGGMTDGMADDVPASIDGQEQAALSDGEFVIPADVVSHLGNGNSNAGAKELYDMMERIRAARTGNKEQGRQINPSRLMPN